MGNDFKVTYIYHSSFCVEFENAVFIFDYFKGELPKFHENKNIYFFASHKHYDHFDNCIFNYKDIYPNIKFILSYDIKLTDKYLKNMNIPFNIRENVISIGKDTSVDIDDLHIETLGSTDRGVAYIVKYNDKTLYHAGDLNWWHKPLETKQYNNNMAADFKREIDKVKGRYFDVAFLPLDSRFPECFYYGFDYFMKNTYTKYAVPMHLWDDYTTINKLKELDISNEYRNKVVDISHENEKIIF